MFLVKVDGIRNFAASRFCAGCSKEQPEVQTGGSTCVTEPHPPWTLKPQVDRFASPEQNVKIYDRQLLRVRESLLLLQREQKEASSSSEGR